MRLKDLLEVVSSGSKIFVFDNDRPTIGAIAIREVDEVDNCVFEYKYNGINSIEEIEDYKVTFVCSPKENYISIFISK